MAQKGRRRWRSLLVEPFEQVKLGLIFLMVNSIFGALILGVFGYYVYDIYKAVSVYFQLTQQESYLTLYKFVVPLSAAAGLILLFVLITLYASIKYTHEIYGPLVSIHRFLDDLLSGRKPGVINLRESDQLQDLANKLNSIAERMIDDQRSGPMVQVHRFLDELMAGKRPSPLQLRDADQFKELATKLNALANKISQ